MGDRCGLFMTIHESDKKLVEGVFGIWELESEAPGLAGCLRVEFSEVNYGGQEELEVLARQCVPFFGSHSSGGDYGPMAFASCDGTLEEIDANINGEPMVPIDAETGGALPDQQNAVEAYVHRLNLTKAEFRRREPRASTKPSPHPTS